MWPVPCEGAADSRTVTPGARALLEAAGVAGEKDAGLIALEAKGAADAFVTAAKKQRIWAREHRVRSVP